MLSPSYNRGATYMLSAYEQAGYLHLLNPETGDPLRLRIGIATDLNELRERWAKGTKWIRKASVSPSGARAAFEYRGEILTVPREKGDARNLTQTPGIHERSPAWSPDGKWIAYFSDASGEYRLYLAAQDGTTYVRVLPVKGAGFYEDLKWSPDSKMVSFVDNSHTIWIMDIGIGEQFKVSSDVIYGPVPTLHHAWSPDSYPPIPNALWCRSNRTGTSSTSPTNSISASTG